MADYSKLVEALEDIVRYGCDCYHPPTHGEKCPSQTAQRVLPLVRQLIEENERLGKAVAEREVAYYALEEDLQTRLTAAEERAGLFELAMNQEEKLRKEAQARLFAAENDIKGKGGWAEKVTELLARLAAAEELNAKQYDELVVRDKKLKRAEEVVEAAKDFLDKRVGGSLSEFADAIRRYEEEE